MRGIPTVVIDGISPPTLRGRGWHYVNARGVLIRHPNAYRRAWGKPIYVASTRRVEVGRLYRQYAAVCRLLGLSDTTPPEIVSDRVLEL